jgi:hypothetical protein
MAMDPRTHERFLALLNKTAADIIADWNWPVWRRDEGPRPGDPKRPRDPNDSP